MDAKLAKCSCSHCDGHLEFETAYAGERVTCPHCGKETLLYIPGSASPPPIPSPAPAPITPAIQSTYRLADSAGPQTPPPRPIATPPRKTSPRNLNPFARQAAKASWVSFIFTWFFSKMAQGFQRPPGDKALLLAALVFVLLGFAFAIVALSGIRKHGTKGILIPALVGIILNGGVVLMALLGLLKRLNDGRQPQEAAASASSSTQSVATGKVPVEPAVKRPSKPGEPIVILLEPGTEPRKVLRLQPKAGDKQTVVFTMKMAMDPGPVTNMPPIAMTTQTTIKNVSADGNIGYERVITDVGVPAGSGPMKQVVESLKPAFSSLKGLTTTGVISSRGFSISRQTQNKGLKSGQVLPAVVRLFRMQMDEAVDRFAAPLPEEAVGAGGKWEVEPADESRGEVVKTVYEIVSLEKNRVAAKITVTASAAKQNANDLAMTGGGSGEMTRDLARLMPVRGNLVYRMEASGSDPAGGPKGRITMKMRMDLRVEAK